MSCEVNRRRKDVERERKGERDREKTERESEITISCVENRKEEGCRERESREK